MKQIPLTQGKFALVDDEDYDFLMQWKWHYRPETSSSGYAARSHNFYNEKGKRTAKQIWMHRVINKTMDNFDTDHCNGNGLDNQKSNLRTANRAQNIANRCKIKSDKATSKYKCVSYMKKTNRWRCNIKAGKKTIFSSFFDTEIEAALSYNKEAIKLYGDFAKLNEV